jgi:CYTH domain-containing protein
MEIERKFLVERLPELDGARSTEIAQGYLAVGGDGSEVRVRRRDGAATLTVKRGGGLARGETEIELTPEQFGALWPLTAAARVEKVRHELALGPGVVAELDVYAGALEGLVVVEVEFESEAAAGEFSPPDWFGAEVTDDDAYKNRRLAIDGRP